MNAKDILKGFDKARADRITIENTWEDIVYYVIPRKRGITNRYEPGDKMQTDVYDDTAIQSNLILAAGLSGYMTNASQRWFELAARDEEVMAAPGVRQFFDDCSEIMYSALSNSNFYQQIHETYLDLGSVGMSTLYEEEDPIEDVRFFSRPPKEIYAVENENEIIDMVYRCFEFSAKQAYEKFGKDKCGEVVRKAVEETRDFGKMFVFIHHVGKRFEKDVSKKNSENMDYFSYWVNKEEVKIVKEGGYDEFPFYVSRFYKNSGEPYGYGPAFVCFPDIVMLNRMMKLYIEAGEIALYPPYLAENDGIIGTLDLRAAAINYQRQPISQGPAITQLNTKGSNQQIAIDFINRTEGNIKASYFTDLFLMLTQNNNMTATEVIERTQEKMLMLGPVLGRLQTELLNPIIKRTFNILLRRGKLPTVPEALLDSEYDIVYVSPLAKAQRAAQARDTQTFLNIIGGMSQMIPDVLDSIDGDKVVEKLATIYSIDPSIIRESDEIDAIRGQRAEAQGMEQKMAMLDQVANTAKTGTEAQKNDATAQATRAE